MASLSDYKNSNNNQTSSYHKHYPKSSVSVASFDYFREQRGIMYIDLGKLVL